MNAELFGTVNETPVGDCAPETLLIVGAKVNVVDGVRREVHLASRKPRGWNRIWDGRKWVRLLRHGRPLYQPACWPAGLDLEITVAPEPRFPLVDLRGGGVPQPPRRWDFRVDDPALRDRRFVVTTPAGEEIDHTFFYDEDAQVLGRYAVGGDGKPIIDGFGLVPTWEIRPAVVTEKTGA